MYHLHIKIKDSELDIGQIARSINSILAKNCVQIVKYYSNERMGKDNWFLIFRDVNAENWNDVCAGITKVFRNLDCEYQLKHPTIKPKTVTVRKIKQK